MRAKSKKGKNFPPIQSSMHQIPYCKELSPSQKKDLGNLYDFSLPSHRCLAQHPSRTLSPRKEEEYLSHFMLKYLERRDQYDGDGADSSEFDHSFQAKSDLKINPQFRRVYRRKIRQGKKDSKARFMIGAV